jgi:hypothetical protein
MVDRWCCPIRRLGGRSRRAAEHQDGHQRVGNPSKPRSRCPDSNHKTSPIDVSLPSESVPVTAQCDQTPREGDPLSSITSKQVDSRLCVFPKSYRGFTDSIVREPGTIDSFRITVKVSQRLFCPWVWRRGALNTTGEKAEKYGLFNLFPHETLTAHGPPRHPASSSSSASARSW